MGNNLFQTNKPPTHLYWNTYPSSCIRHWLSIHRTHIQVVTPSSADHLKKIERNGKKTKWHGKDLTTLVILSIQRKAPPVSAIRIEAHNWGHPCGRRTCTAPSLACAQGGVAPAVREVWPPGAPTPGSPGSRRNGAAGEGSDRVHAAHVEDEGDAAAAQRCEGLRVRVVDAHGADIAGLV
jgi:hypothetical protein